MKIKKIALYVLSLALVATIAIGGTLAYLTSTDSDVNVMTVGNVKIEQQEWQRADGVTYNNGGNSAEKGDLVPFVQGQALYPAVPKTSNAYTAEQSENECFHWGDYSPGWNGLWNENKIANVMDKIVMVKNTGKSDAYYRTVFAFECPEGMTYGQGSNSDFMMNMNKRFNKETVGFTTINGTRYMIQVATYTDILKSGETSRPSLIQVLMTDHVTNEQVALLGDTYDILVVSQAVQAKGFDDADTALNTAFGDVTVEKAVEWFGGTAIPTVVNVATAEEAQAALDNAVRGTVIKLAPGVNYGDLVIRVNESSELVDCWYVMGNPDTGLNYSNKYQQDSWRYAKRTVEDLTIVGADGASIGSLTTASARDDNGNALGTRNNMFVIKNLTLTNVTFTKGVSFNTGSTLMATESAVEEEYVAAVTIDGLTLNGCVLNGTKDDGTLLGISNTSKVASNVKNIVVSNCIANTAENGVYIVDGVNVKITNNTFNNIGFNAVHINDMCSGEIVVQGNVINGCDDRVFRFNGIKSGKVIVSDNTVTNSNGDNGEYMKASSMGANVKLTWKNNTVDGVEIVTTTVNGYILGTKKS